MAFTKKEQPAAPVARKAIPADKPAKAAVQAIPAGTVLVANQHSGPIILPRSAIQGDQRITLAPTILHPGTVTPITREVWEEHKKLVVIQHYLDRRLLAEVSQEGAVPVMDATSTNLDACIPDNLKTEKEQGNIAGVEAKVNVTAVGNASL